MCVCCVCVVYVECVLCTLHVCPPLRLLITSDVIWTLYDWLNKFYSFYMAVVLIISSGGLRIKAHCRNYPLNSHFKQLCISNKLECFSYKGGYGVCKDRILMMSLKGELHCLTPQINGLGLYNVIKNTVTALRHSKELHKVLNLKQYCMHCCVVLTNYSR